MSEVANPKRSYLMRVPNPIADQVNFLRDSAKEMEEITSAGGTKLMGKKECRSLSAKLWDRAMRATCGLHTVIKVASMEDDNGV